MRFMALLRKELRESLPWILAAVIALLVIGGYSIRSQATRGKYGWQLNVGPGQAVEPYRLLAPSVLQDSATLLLWVSIGLGLALGARHFGMPSLTRTWPFLLHRSTTRTAILLAKLLAGIVAQVVCLGLAWLLLFKYASRPDLFMIPPPTPMIADGALLILLGLLVYCGTTLSALSKSRWYTTRVFGLALAGVVVFAMAFHSSRPWALATILIAALILLSQIVHTFLTREF
jgi:hypothetical protein